MELIFPMSYLQFVETMKYRFSASAILDRYELVDRQEGAPMLFHGWAEG
ncbi:hypothetical protein RCO27_18680 [Sphingosinicella sp. LHD-64]|nr:hypothetical protein [Sphingosinicella sp. LHD-64]MDQ8758259.1 hypothetical protein [Sphingosinicella sp. LHD-64]